VKGRLKLLLKTNGSHLPATRSHSWSLFCRSDVLYISFQINDRHIFEGEEFYKHIRIKPKTASEMLAFLFYFYCSLDSRLLSSFILISYLSTHDLIINTHE